MDHDLHKRIEDIEEICRKTLQAVSALSEKVDSLSESVITFSESAKTLQADVSTLTEEFRNFRDKFWFGTKAEYDAIAPKDKNILYIAE